MRWLDMIPQVIARGVRFAQSLGSTPVALSGIPPL
jgi:hypothetical protein